MSSSKEPHLHPEVGYILFLDIVGYSKLLIDEQKELVQELNRIVRETKEFRAAEAEGKLTRLPTGDGMALVFTTNPEAPVECALEISKALQDHPKLNVRMGIHSGPVNPVADVNDRSNLAGTGINMAQRVMHCGDAGHILLSKHLAEDLEHYTHWRSVLHDIGEVKVKHGVRIPLVNLYTDQLGNSALPAKLKQARAAFRVRYAAIAGLLLVTVFGAIFWMLRRSEEKSSNAAGVISDKSLAVLPFENLSRDPDNAYFADGVQEEILTGLARIADLRVISRTSTWQYQSKPRNLAEIAKQLAIANVLEGSVQKVADQVRVTVQLINAQTNSQEWAETYDRRLTDIFGVETEIAKGIADSLQARLTGREEQALAAKATNNPEAYDNYLRGLAYTLKTAVTSTNYLSAQKYLREAVRLDPKFSLAWALLSSVDSLGYLTATLQPTVALRKEAQQAAEIALSLQPKLGEALVAQGYYHYACLKDYDTATRYFEQARHLLPNNSSIPESLAYVTRRRGQWDRSESYFNEAERLDPRNASLLTQHACSYIMLRRFSEGSQKLDQVLDIAPDDVGVLALKANIAQAEGDLPRAATLLRPPHSNADDPSTLGTRIYQATLERNPTQIIPRVKEELAKLDPARGFQTGELRFWLGWTQEVAGDDKGAQESWQQARSELEPLLKEQPENWSVITDLALTNMGLGDKPAAFALLERALAAMPIDKDAVDGPAPIEILARVAAQMGEPDRAISSLQILLSIPSPALPPLTPALLRLDPMFDPLRNDPRFQKLCQDEQP